MIPKYKQFERVTLRAGDFRHRITLQTINIEAPSGNGSDYDMDYADLATVWAALRTVSQRQEFDAINTEEQITHRFYIRKNPELTINKTNAILYNSKRYNIVQTEEINEDSKYIRLDCNLKGDSSKDGSKW